MDQSEHTTPSTSPERVDRPTEDDMERVRDGAHRALLDVLQDVERLTGSGDQRSLDLVWTIFVTTNGGDDQVAARRRYLDREIHWLAPIEPA